MKASDGVEDEAMVSHTILLIWCLATISLECSFAFGG